MMRYEHLQSSTKRKFFFTRSLSQIDVTKHIYLKRVSMCRAKFEPDNWQAIFRTFGRDY